MTKEPKDGDIRLKHTHIRVFKVFGEDKREERYTMQRYHSSNGWADVANEEDYLYL